MLALTALTLTHCADKSNSPSPTQNVEPTFSSLYTHVLSKNCVGCHEPQGSATINANTTLNFTSLSLAYQTLTQGTSVGLAANISAECSNVPLIVGGEPLSSYLLATLFIDYFKTDFYKQGCTPHSPSAHGATVNSNEKSAFVQWIQNGALNN